MLSSAERLRVTGDGRAPAHPVATLRGCRDPPGAAQSCGEASPGPDLGLSVRRRGATTRFFLQIARHLPGPTGDEKPPPGRMFGAGRPKRHDTELNLQELRASP